MQESDSNCPSELRSYLQAAVDLDASDLHVSDAYPAMVRVHGELRNISEEDLDPQALEGLLEPLCSEELLTQLRQNKNVDFSLSVELSGVIRRFRANLFYSGRALGGCFRLIPNEIPEFAWAGFPVDLARRLCSHRNGLVLFTGVTGSGKSTSLAMIINMINQGGGARIITVEEPVEYIFPRVPTSMVTQREVGVDVENFSDGLKYGLRQDPDVILVGEIRDQETAKMALSAAETGHLVFSTLHTRDAKGAISRFADLFHQSVQGAICSQLAMSLRAVISQHLLPSSVVGEKRVLALEVLFNNMPIAAAIRMGRVESIDNSILTGRAEGMYTLNESLRRLVQSGHITPETAKHYTNDAASLVQ